MNDCQGDQTNTSKQKHWCRAGVESPPALEELTPMDTSSALRHCNVAGQTPIAAAITFGSKETVRVLLARGANLCEADVSGRCCLHWALQKQPHHAFNKHASRQLIPFILDVIKQLDSVNASRKSQQNASHATATANHGAFQYCPLMSSSFIPLCMTSTLLNVPLVMTRDWM